MTIEELIEAVAEEGWIFTSLGRNANAHWIAGGQLFNEKGIGESFAHGKGLTPQAALTNLIRKITNSDIEERMPRPNVYDHSRVAYAPPTTHPITAQPANIREILGLDRPKVTVVRRKV